MDLSSADGSFNGEFTPTAPRFLERHPIMKKTLSVSISITSVLALSVLTMSSRVVRAEESIAPVSVQNFQADPTPLESIAVEKNSQGEELVDPTVEQIEQYLQEKNATQAQDDLGEATNDFRISNFDPSTAVGKVIIRVHKSANPKIAEYLEVFVQNSADGNDLTPQKLFDHGSASTALVSTAGTYSGHVYTTPSGTFGLDSMETMHHSHAYNNAPMPWSMFFNGGIAIHGATPDEFVHLGQKASHGCTRVHPDNAHIIFDFVKSKGGKSACIVEVLDK